MDLSLVIVSYNTVALLDNCLASIIRHTKDISYEMIVIDNNSRDASCELVERKFPQVILVKNEDNLGFAKASNQGIRQARGEYVILLNSDTLLTDNSLSTMVSFMRQHPEAGGLNPMLLNADSTLQVPGSKLFNLERWRAKKTHRLSWVSGAAALFPRKLLNEIGLLDENFFFYNEDLDLSIRIRRRGYALYYCAEAKVIHLGGQSTSALNGDAMWYGYQGGFYYCEKHYGRGIGRVYKAVALTDLGLRIALLGLCCPFNLKEKNKDRLTAYQRIFKDALGGKM